MSQDSTPAAGCKNSGTAVKEAIRATSKPARFSFMVGCRAAGHVY